MLEPFHMKDISNHIIIIIIKFIHISVLPVTVPIHPVYTYFKFYNSHICQHVLCAFGTKEEDSGTRCDHPTNETQD